MVSGEGGVKGGKGKFLAANYIFFGRERKCTRRGDGKERWKGYLGQYRNQNG